MRLDEERRQRRRAERVEPVRLGRDLAEEEVPDAADEAGALLEPVDGREHHAFDLLASSGLLSGHRFARSYAGFQG